MTAAFTVGVLLISAIVVLIPTLLGIKRGTVKAGVKLVSAILAAIIAFIVCKVTMPGMGSIFFKLLSIIAGSNEALASIVDMLQKGTVLMTVVVGFVATIIMPFVFVILYLIIKAIIGLVASIVLKALASKGVEFDGIINLGWAVGLVHGVLSLVILAMPVIGLLSIISPFTSLPNETSDSLTFEVVGDLGENAEISINKDQNGMLVGEINGSLVQIHGDESSFMVSSATYAGSEIESRISSICNSFPVKAIGAIGAKPLYRSLTTFKVDGIKVSLLDEAQVLAECYGDIKPLTSTEMKNYSSRQAEAMRLLSYDLQNSELTMLLLSELLPDMSDSWLDNETFLGIKPPSVGKDLDPLKNQLLEITAKTNRKTVKEDVASIFEIVAIIFDHGTLKYTSDSRALMDNIATEGYISQLLAATYVNERMSPLVVEITNLGIRSVGTTLKIPEDNEAVYKDLMNNIAAIVNETASMTSREERQNEIYNKLEVCFADAGVKTTDDERAVISYYLIDQFGARDSVSYGEIEDFFDEVKEGFEETQAVSFGGDVSFVFTSADLDSLSDRIYDFYSGNSSLIIKIKTDAGYSCFESSGGKVTVTAHSVDELGNHVSETYEVNVSDKKDLFDNLSSVEGFECEGKTIQSMLLVSTQGIDDLSTKEALLEFERLENGICKIVEFMNTVEDNGGSKADSSSIEALGNALQELSTNKLLGSSSCDFIEGALKSDFVQENVDGIDNDIVNDVMANLRNEDGSADPDFSLGNTLASGVEAAELVSQLGKDNEQTDKPKEEVEKSLTWLIENMSPSSANVICKMITPTFIRERGLVNGDLNQVSDMLKELFMQMAKSDAMSEEEYKNETKAIQDLYNMMEKATGDNAQNIFTDTGKDGISADSFIESYMSSKLVCATVYNHAFKNGELKIDFLCFGSDSLSESDKSILVSAVIEYYNKHQNSADPMFKDKLRALAAMLCIKLDFTSSGVQASYPETPGMNPLKQTDGHYTYTVGGELVKGWTEINGKLYYFDNQGHAALGWTTLGSERYYFTVETGAYTGVVSIDEVLYAFDANGALIKVIG